MSLMSIAKFVEGEACGERGNVLSIEPFCLAVMRRVSKTEGTAVHGGLVVCDIAAVLFAARAGLPARLEGRVRAGSQDGVWPITALWGVG